MTTAVFTSCEKINPFKKKEVQCTVVSSEFLPVTVSDSFNVKYPGANILGWFNKDNTGFCAIINYSGQDMKVMFDNKGNFVSAEIEGDNGNQTGNHHDKNNNDSGCECSLPENESD